MTVETSGASLEALKETPAQHDARMAWWREAKFGLFIHWGVYSVPAGKYGTNTSGVIANHISPSVVPPVSIRPAVAAGKNLRLGGKTGGAK